ncbi:MAG: hypothetical protein ACRDRJ_22170 [Streptosporangiaceae bacterium]
MADSSPAPRQAICPGREAVQARGVSLLGVRVTALAALSVAEHARRDRAGLGAVTSPALLDRLLDLPAGVPVADVVAWAALAGQPPGIAACAADGRTVTRLLTPPLTISDVVLPAAPGREIAAVQAASLFAGFTRRWIAVQRHRVPDAAVLEAEFSGVGILDRHGGVLLAGGAPICAVIDQWGWLLQEKAYRRWLGQRPGR